MCWDVVLWFDFVLVGNSFSFAVAEAVAVSWCVLVFRGVFVSVCVF